MIRVYIIAEAKNIAFAEKLLDDIRDIKVISNPSEKERNVDIKRTMENADAILAIIDDEFFKNTFLNFELQWAQKLVKKNRNMMLLPVVLNNAGVPKSIKEMSCISFDPKSETDLLVLQLAIGAKLTHREVNIRKSRDNVEVKSKTSYMIILTLAIEVFAMFFVILLFKYPYLNLGEMDTYMSSLLASVTVAVSVFSLITSYLSIMRRRRHEDDEEEIASYSRRLKKAIVPEEIKEEENSEAKETKNEIDALGRMMINLEDIKEFYTWSQKQAKASFVLAVVMCIFGLILMIAAIVLLVAFKLNFQMSLIPALGGVITEVIAGTALVVYRSSLSQLNHYHKALHEDERFLSSVNLLGKFSTVEAQDGMLREIIRSEIQMNLDGFKGNKNTKTSESREKEKLKY